MLILIVAVLTCRSASTPTRTRGLGGLPNLNLNSNLKLLGCQ
jgi:hypothetical protein